MGLSGVIEDVKDQEKTLTLYNPSDEDFVDDVVSFFASQNAAVTAEWTPSGRPDGLAVLTLNGDTLAAVRNEDLRDLLEEAPPGSGGVGIDDSEHRELLRHLKETTFTSYDREQMLRASREIEDRAWRIGGELHAGFQSASILDGQRERYEQLAANGVDAYAYAVPDREPPIVEGVTVVGVDTDELSETWFVAFDGGEEKTALLARERSPGEFYGVWTYDPSIVDRIVDHVVDRYDPIPS